MAKVGDKVQINELGLYCGSCGIVTDNQRVGTYSHKVIFEDGDWSVFTEKDLIVLSTEEEKVMTFKVGDKVKVKDSWFGHDGDIGTIVDYDGEPAYPFLVEFDMGRQGVKDETFNEESLELIEPEEETSMKFKVGDKVKVTDSWFGHDGRVGVVFKIDNYEPFNYSVKFDVEGDNERRDENFMGDSLELVTEEEKVMKFKVGDKVKVSNSWDGNTGNVGKITERNDGYNYPYCVTFEVGNDESFREEELELVKEKAEKQSFTKSDLKTGMGVVLRDGSKGHVLLGTEAGDVIRFINGGSNQWASVDEYDENMIDCDTSAVDIIEVYSSRFAYACLTDRVFNQDCVFKREEPKPEPKPEPEPIKMTMKEINEHFGKPIEIIE